MDEFARFAGGWDQVVPAPGDVGVRVETEDAGGDGVAMMVVVEEPAVELSFAEGGLDGFQLHGKSIRHFGAGTAIGNWAGF